MLSLLPRILSWGRLRDRWLVESGHGVRYSCPLPLSVLSGSGHFRRNSRWRILVFIIGFGSPRWSRQPAAGAAGPSGGAGLLILEPWRLLERQPADSSALGMPHKSSPRQKVNVYAGKG
jgi:hypothetical protein